MRQYLIFLYALAFAGQSLAAGDIKGSRDHRVVKRYKDSVITQYKYSKFAEYALITNKLEKEIGSGGKLDKNNSIPLEGKMTMITYQTPANRTTLEIFRNYLDAFKKANFDILYTCKNAECGGMAFNYSMKVNLSQDFAGQYADQRYIAAKVKSDKSEFYVSMYVVFYKGAGGESKDKVMTQLNVVETAKMEKNMVVIDANAMEKEISSKGSIALYGVHFDHDKAVIKPESKPTLDQVAKLLKIRPKLKLVVVGHTDNQGKFQYNMSLSDRRAKAVANALVKNYGIAPARLRGWGVGYLSPIASNQTDAGRAKNRRVELVEQ